MNKEKLKTLNISNEIAIEIIKIQGEYLTKYGKRISTDKALRFLIFRYWSHKNQKFDLLVEDDLKEEQEEPKHAI